MKSSLLCPTAQRLRKEWAKDVQNATMNSWQDVMFGKRKVDRHVKGCKKCKANIKAQQEI